MDFNHFLTSYMPDTNVGSKQHFKNMLEECVVAEKLGYATVSIPEHHLINLLMMPSPLQMAVKIASITKNIKITTGIVVLPLHDMRTYAGEVATADILTDGRLILGVGRGAFAWEMQRLGTPIEKSKEKFIESLEVLQLLLKNKEVSYKGKFYDFEPITIMPRPISNPVQMMIAAMNLESIKDAASRGFHVQSTVLSGTKDLLLSRVNAFKEGCAKLGEEGKLLKLSMQRMAYLAKDENEAREKTKLAYEYYKRFDNMFTGPGKVKEGNIEALPRKQTLEELKENILQVEESIQLMLLPKDKADANDVILEIRAGTGGDEAAIFAGDLYRMYQRYSDLNKWKTQIMALSDGDVGGYKEIILSISGENVFSKLKFESGVHRVQRVPATESSGRIHTSAATVAVLPEPEDVDVDVQDKDIRIDVFRASGPGAVSYTHLTLPTKA